MLKFLPLLAVCAACSAAVGSREDAATPAPRSFATQTGAPSPDYQALLKQAAPAVEGWKRRDATAPAPLPPAARAIGAAWVARLEQRGALLGHGLAGNGPDEPVIMIDTGLTEAEFDSWVKENGWRVPGHIRWSFVPELKFPPVSEAAAAGIRMWPASRARTGAQHQALLHGRVELRDGCFFVGQAGRPADKLAWFHAEIGLDVDAEGYFILRERVGGKLLARVGEDMNWGGPATAVIDQDTARALHDACGPGEIYVVGSPESSERFLAQFPHLRERQAPPPPPSRTVGRQG